MKRTIKYQEPEVLLEVREWKRKASERFEKLGFEEYQKQAASKSALLNKRIEEARRMKSQNAA